MRYVLIFWAVPMGLFWGWYTLSYHDINFGMLFFSRLLHDFVFEFYGQHLGLDPQMIPAMVAQACVVDTFLIMGILAFRRRKQIVKWWQARRQAKATGYANAALEAGQEPLEG